MQQAKLSLCSQYDMYCSLYYNVQDLVPNNSDQFLSELVKNVKNSTDLINKEKEKKFKEIKQKFSQENDVIPINNWAPFFRFLIVYGFLEQAKELYNHDKTVINQAGENGTALEQYIKKNFPPYSGYKTPTLIWLFKENSTFPKHECNIIFCKIVEDKLPLPEFRKCFLLWLTNKISFECHNQLEKPERLIDIFNVLKISHQFFFDKATETFHIAYSHYCDDTDIEQWTTVLQMLSDTMRQYSKVLDSSNTPILIPPIDIDLIEELPTFCKIYAKNNLSLDESFGDKCRKFLKAITEYNEIFCKKFAIKNIEDKDTQNDKESKELNEINSIKKINKIGEKQKNSVIKNTVFIEQYEKGIREKNNIRNITFPFITHLVTVLLKRSNLASKKNEYFDVLLIDKIKKLITYLPYTNENDDVFKRTSHLTYAIISILEFNTGKSNDLDDLNEVIEYPNKDFNAFVENFNVVKHNLKRFVMNFNNWFEKTMGNKNEVQKLKDIVFFENIHTTAEILVDYLNKNISKKMTTATSIEGKQELISIINFSQEVFTVFNILFNYAITGKHSLNSYNVPNELKKKTIQAIVLKFDYFKKQASIIVDYKLKLENSLKPILEEKIIDIKKDTSNDKNKKGVTITKKNVGGGFKKKNKKNGKKKNKKTNRKVKNLSTINVVDNSPINVTEKHIEIREKKISESNPQLLSNDNTYSNQRNPSLTKSTSKCGNEGISQKDNEETLEKVNEQNNQIKSNKTDTDIDKKEKEEKEKKIELKNNADIENADKDNISEGSTQPQIVKFENKENDKQNNFKNNFTFFKNSTDSKIFKKTFNIIILPPNNYLPYGSIIGLIPTEECFIKTYNNFSKDLQRYIDALKTTRNIGKHGKGLKRNDNDMIYRIKLGANDPSLGGKCCEKLSDLKTKYNFLLGFINNYASNEKLVIEANNPQFILFYEFFRHDRSDNILVDKTDPRAHPSIEENIEYYKKNEINEINEIFKPISLQ